MPHLISPRFLLYALSLALHIAAGASIRDQNSPFVGECYTANGSNNYESNLLRLFATLIASASTSASLYSYNSTTPPQITGLAQCRPDLSPAACASCLNSTAAFAYSPMISCGWNSTGAFRSGNCLLRYSNQTFNAARALQNQGISSDEDGKTQNSSASFASQVQVLMKGVMASAEAAALRFAVGAVSVSEDAMDVYGMGWCSMDFAGSDCAKCFDSVWARIPAGKIRGMAGSVNCQLRFETYQFYGSSVIKTPSPVAVAGVQRTNNLKKFILIGTFAAVALFLIFSLFLLLLLRIRKRKLTPLEIEQAENEMIVDVETFMFDFDTLRKATDDFSKENKLGQGGFGSVYKGMLESGQEIAVKKLSRTSKQGLSEMKNEIRFIARLQHKNLVKLLGYCLEGEEKLLVYEYLPNGSLDKLLFDPVKRMKLSWKTRLKIIEGIGRGLLYLHEDSHFRVIHRDLKASNILLDDDMNPKISDFGLAKLFSADETHKNTRRIAGTYGYMAPEYALRGRFSTKSDVFSYGVLALEIITGRKNSSFLETDQELGLPNYIWQCWNEGTGLKVVDQSWSGECQPQEVLRHIQIGLLCVQEDLEQRPSMAMLGLMHSTSSLVLPFPRKPAFCRQASASNDVPASVNDMTISVMEAR